MSTKIYGLDATTCFSQGMEYFKQNELESAEKCFGVVTQLNPKFSYAHYALGTVCALMGKLDKAIEDLK